MSKDEIKYSILMELLKKESEPKFTDYNINQEDFGDIVFDLQESGYIRNASFAKAKGKISITLLDKAKITPEGEKYLKKILY